MFVPTGGLEPPIFGLGDRRLIHWATRAPMSNHQNPPSHAPRLHWMTTKFASNQKPILSLAFPPKKCAYVGSQCKRWEGGASSNFKVDSQRRRARGLRQQQPHRVRLGGKAKTTFLAALNYWGHIFQFWNALMLHVHIPGFINIFGF